jgi:hypothetical protein
MAGDLSDTAEALVRCWLFSTSSATRPTGWFLALYTSAPSDAGGGVEVAGGGYARQPISFDAAGAVNGADLVFGPASTAWGTVTHAAIFDNAGRFLAWRALETPIAVAADDSLTLPAGALTAEFD